MEQQAATFTSGPSQLQSLGGRYSRPRVQSFKVDTRSWVCVTYLQPESPESLHMAALPGTLDGPWCSVQILTTCEHAWAA